MHELTIALENVTSHLTRADGDPTALTEYDARDWAGFFAALSSFISTLLPLILPLFAEPKTH